MILTAHQPSYLPWLGLFAKIALADEFCIINIAQYERGGFDNRNRIKTASGPLWLTVPVESKDHFNKRVGDIRIKPNGWNRKHIKTIAYAYAKAPFFETYFPELEAILGTTHERLTDLNAELLRFFLRQLGLTPVVRRTDDYDLVGHKSDLVLDLCRKLGATTYIFGSLGRGYADVASFDRAGVATLFHSYAHPQYAQLHGSFEPYMSVIDVLFNAGPRSLDVIMSGNALTPQDFAVPR